MATNSNSNSVNIASLPQAQLATSEDLLILETQNGTQTIQFQNFNVVRTDVAGNATVVGNISGDIADFGNIYTDTLQANQVLSNNELGTSTTYGYYNQFKTTNGVTVSAAYIVGSPEYLLLLNLFSTLSGNSSPAYKKVYEFNTVAEIPNGRITSDFIYAGSFPNDSSGNSVGALLGGSSLYSSYFTITPFSEGTTTPATPTTPSLSAFQYINPGPGSDYFSFCIALPSVNSTGFATKYGLKITYFYN